MKKMIFLALTLVISPLFAGVNCLTNTKNLSEAYDTKEWHNADCSCNCEREIIRKRYCTECGHLQDAHPLIVVTPTQLKTFVKYAKIYAPENAEDVIKKITANYLKNKNDV